MTKRMQVSALLLGSACGVPTGSEVPTTGADATGGNYPTYFISEQNFYDNPFSGCQESNPVSVIGKNLHTAMKAKGWVGPYAEDVTPCPAPKCSLPTDFVEGSAAFANQLKGADHLWGDNNTLAVYAGHGAHDALVFRRNVVTPTGAKFCEVRFTQHVRLGIAWGGRARVAAYGASCVGYAADLNEAGGADDFHDGLGLNGSWQHLAFYDSPRLHPDQLAGFVDEMELGGATSNLTAWIGSQWLYSFQDEYYNQPIVWTGSDSVIDAGQPPDYIGTRHESANLFTRAHLPPPSPTRVDTAQFTASFDDGDPGNDDPEPSDCIDNIAGN